MKLGEDGFVDELDAEVTVAEQDLEEGESRGDEHEAYKKLCRGEDFMPEK